ncbi:MAG: hypothetical protein ABI670_23340, partial [Chloroflexota bacterium]
TAFPVVASLMPASSVAGWIGVVDVALAGVVLIASVAADAAARSRHKTTPASVVQSSYRTYRALGLVPLLLLVLFFLFSNQVRWEVLLPGLAWRAWLLMYVLPSVLLLWRDSM